MVPHMASKFQVGGSFGKSIIQRFGFAGGDYIDISQCKFMYLIRGHFTRHGWHNIKFVVDDAFIGDYEVVEGVEGESGE